MIHIAVPHPGNEQQAQWLQVRRIKPDWVILRGWGVMNPTALKSAAKAGFPRDHIVGVWWSGAEEDTIPAGEAAEGYIAAAFNLPGTSFPVMQDVLKHVYAKGKGELDDKSRIGSIYYTRGVVAGIVTAESIRTAQEKFGRKPLTGEEVRWGIENLRIDDSRLKQIGAVGLMKLAARVLPRPRGRRRGEVRAVGRQEVERDQRLDRIRPVDRAPHDRGVGGEVREGKGHHAARLLKVVRAEAEGLAEVLPPPDHLTGLTSADRPPVRGRCCGSSPAECRSSA